MKAVLVLITIGAICLVAPIIAYLWVQNRNSELLTEKIMSTISVALFGILSALLFSLKSEEMGSDFASTVIFHKFDKKPLDAHFEGDSRLEFGGDQFTGPLAAFVSQHAEKSEELSKAEFSKDSNSIVEFYHNMMLVRLLDHFFWMYSARWDTNVYSVRRGAGESKESFVDSDKMPPNYDRVSWTDLVNEVPQSNLRDLLSSFSRITEITVPPKTKITFVPGEYKKEILLRNPFVEVAIAVNKTGGSTGLGDYKWLLGYSNKKADEFWSAHFRITCRAKFAKLKSGHPAMAKYKQWVQVMFGEVRYLLDEKEQLKRAHEYRELIRE